MTEAHRPEPDWERMRADDAANARYARALEYAKAHPGRVVGFAVCGLPGKHDLNQRKLVSVHFHRRLGYLLSESEAQDMVSAHPDEIEWRRRHVTDGRRADVDMVKEHVLLLGVAGAEEIPVVRGWCREHGRIDIPADDLREFAAVTGKPRKLVIRQTAQRP